MLLNRFCCPVNSAYWSTAGCSLPVVILPPRKGNELNGSYEKLKPAWFPWLRVTDRSAGRRNESRLPDSNGWRNGVLARRRPAPCICALNPVEDAISFATEGFALLCLA